MNTTTDRNAERAEGILKRLAELAETHSQADIARKTEFSRNNVSRYVNGTRMPIEFAAALVEGLGINPAWLLTGEGTPYLSDVSAGTAEMAGDLLALVEAMGAVNRMRLGSLAGKHHLGVLRKLNDAMQDYEKLRADLNKHSRKVFLKLIEEVRNANVKRDLNRAETLLQAAEQVARLSDDWWLQSQLEGAQSHFHHNCGEPEKALPHQKKSFLAYLLNHTELDEWTRPEAHNYVMILLSAHRVREARRIARATIELFDGDHPQMRALAAAIDIELGDLRRGLDDLRRLLPDATTSYRRNIEQTLARGQLLEGSMTIEQAAAFGGDSDAKWSYLASCSAACENQEWVDFVLKHGVNKQGMDSEYILAVHLSCLREVLSEGSGTAAQRLLVHIDNTLQKQDPMARFAQECMAAQLFRLGGQHKAARNHLDTAQALLHENTEVQPRLELRIIHARNVLELCRPGDPPHAEAVAFVRDYIARGYHVLKDLDSPE
ncbi:MAG: helix-turn-helix domain-containing protein [Planctomycetes bacterium]|nr:helix-turn-helix domain-containing protein [Planctomycetota bacterium]